MVTLTISWSQLSTRPRFHHPPAGQRHGLDLGPQAQQDPLSLGKFTQKPWAPGELSWPPSPSDYAMWSPYGCWTGKAGRKTAPMDKVGTDSFPHPAWCPQGTLTCLRGSGRTAQGEESPKRRNAPIMQLGQSSVGRAGQSECLGPKPWMGPKWGWHTALAACLPAWFWGTGRGTVLVSGKHP